MTWLVETPPRSASPGSLLAALLKAELRQYWWLQPAVLGSGLAVWALLEAVTSRAPTQAPPEGVVFNYLGSLVLSLFPVLLAGPVITGTGAPDRHGIWLALPLSRHRVNLLRLLGPVIGLWPALLTWPLIISLLREVYGPVSWWVVINAVLLVGIGLILTLRTAWSAFIIFLILPLQIALAHFIPGGQPAAAAWAQCLASVWACAALLAAGAGLAAYALNTHPPRKG